MAKLYKLVAKTSSLCSEEAGRKVFDLINAGAAQFKTILDTDAIFPSLHFDEKDEFDSNLFAVITSFTISGKDAIDELEAFVNNPDVSFEWETATELPDGNIEFTATVKLESAAQRRKTFATSVDIDLEIQRIVAEGIDTREELERKVMYMQDNLVNEDIILNVIKGYTKYAKKAHRPSGIYVDPDIAACKTKGFEGKVASALRYADLRFATLLEGEKSTGKNVFTETIAWLLGMPLHLITFNRQMSPASIYGEKTTDNTAQDALRTFDPEIKRKADTVNMIWSALSQSYAASGEHIDFREYLRRCRPSFEEDEEILRQAAEYDKAKAAAASVNITIDASELYDWVTDGGVMCFNEMNMADANFFASFTNQLLDGTGFLFFPGRGEVPINPRCVLIGTQNAEYEGVEAQNEATMSRIGCICFPQPKSIINILGGAVEAEFKRRGRVPTYEIGHGDLLKVDNFYKSCAGAVTKGTISNASLNIRGFVRALTVLGASGGNASLKQLITDQVVNTCPVDERDSLTIMLGSAFG